MIVGVDEVGRGCLAGPVCVAAVSLPRKIQGLDDSKKIPAPKRRILALKIRQRAIFIGIGWASPAEVDQYNVVGALKLAAERALAPISHQPDIEILLDGHHNYLGRPNVRTIIGGDALVPTISAASIVAKVARDSYMHAMHMQFARYGFNAHVGYGTKQHRDALSDYGPCELHRMSFAPLKTLTYALHN